MAGEPTVGRAREQRGIGRWAVPAYFAGLVLLGLLLFRDFGVSWDEPDYYRYGELTRSFYLHGDHAFETFSNLRFYGPVIPLLQALVSHAIDPTTTGTFSLAHLVNWLFFAAGAAALYRILLLHTRSWAWSLLGPTMLVLSPRLFSHGFVNPKDTPFLALLTINVWLLVEHLERPRRWLLPLLGVVTGLLLDIRVLGLLAVGFTMVALALESPGDDPRERRRAFLISAWTYLGVALVVMVALWPYLWGDPVGRFADSLSTMTSFTDGPQTTVFMGQLLPKISQPWYYAPVWIAITTPLVYLLLAAAGLVRGLRHDPRRLYAARSVERHLFLYAAWLILPIALVVVRQSPLYDEWRHLNFTYPALLIFAVLGAKATWEWLRARWSTPVVGHAFLALLLASMATVGAAMVRLHPYEAVYFTRLAGGLHGASDDFELDYWGLSYRELLEFLVDEVPTGDITVFACSKPGPYNAAMIEERARLRWVGTAAEADFVVCAPREAILGIDAEPPAYAAAPRLFEVRREGATIGYVADLRDQ
jgi:hypothetical protein